MDKVIVHGEREGGSRPSDKARKGYGNEKEGGREEAKGVRGVWTGVWTCESGISRALISITSHA